MIPHFRFVILILILPALLRIMFCNACNFMDPACNDFRVLQVATLLVEFKSEFEN
jgi:hypothetical protein